MKMRRNNFDLNIVLWNGFKGFILGTIFTTTLGVVDLSCSGENISCILPVIMTR